MANKKTRTVSGFFMRWVCQFPNCPLVSRQSAAWRDLPPV
jgi:hypothetical protein